jgi:methylglutamate dehydrogenase subunit D
MNTGRSALVRRHGLEQLATPGARGAAARDGGIEVTLRPDVALATVMVLKGRKAEFERRVKELFGLELPAQPRRVAHGPIAFVWGGPGHWLASTEAADGAAFEGQLRQQLADLASVCDQSDARILLRIGGRHAREALAKGLMLDLHPRAFAPGDAAVTNVAHVGVHFWQLDAAPTYEFAVPRGLAESFWHWLMEAAAEFGVTVR